MSGFLTFIGHWHPVVVHLPIGMILGALLLQVLAARGFGMLRPGSGDDAVGRKIVLKAAAVLLLAGALSGLISCITGFTLSTTGEYDAGLVGWHQWMAISLTFFCFYVWSRIRVHGLDRVQWLLSVGLLVLVIVTGHLGGSLTHGSDYLSLGGGAADNVVIVKEDTPIYDLQKARVYAQIVRPLLRQYCYSCHGASRQKGGLRLDDPVFLMKGGKDGIVIVPGHGDLSELIKRLYLAEDDEHHMPPKEKKALNPWDISAIRWWIDQGADMSKRVEELQQPDSIRVVLKAASETRAEDPYAAPGRILGNADMPREDVEAADEKLLEELRNKGLMVDVVADGSHWLGALAFPYMFGEQDSAGRLKADGPGARRLDSVIRLLPGIRKQLISLNLIDMNVGDSAMGMIAQCGKLRALDLPMSRISDAGVGALKDLHDLQVLNLMGNGVSAAGIEQLRGLKKLRNLYLFQTRVRSTDWAKLKNSFLKVEVDTGGYSMPVLETDTAVVRPKILVK